MKNLLLTTALSATLVTPALANDSTIDQIGADNIADVTQTDGTGGTSLIQQTGDNDSATVIQSDDNGTATNNADIQQLEGTGVQTALIDQNNASNGAENTAKIIQDSIQGGNNATIKQDGAGNSATALQGPGESDDVVIPTWFGPIILPTTPGDITNSVSKIAQTGNNNTATTAQIAGSNGGDNNVGLINQDGADNAASIVQGTGTGVNLIGGPALSANDNDNFGDIMQLGIGNKSSIAQGGESGYALNIQDGTDNDSVIVQSGGTPLFGNSADVSQTGDRNTSKVYQTSAGGDDPIVPEGVTADVTQLGDDNMSTISQEPLGGHLATVTQNGDFHVSSIEQDGLLNSSTVKQELNNQTSKIFQTGVSGTAAVSNTAIVQQTHTAGNMSQVTQAGLSNMTTIMQ